MKVLKRLFAVAAAAACAIPIAAAFSGCKATQRYTAVYSDGELIGYELDVSGYKDKLKGDYEIPAVYDGDEGSAPVISIADQAFAGSKITSLTIPATVKDIGIAAFAYTSLKSVTFADGIQIEEIPQGAFSYCASLETVTIPESVKILGYFSFMACESLKSIDIPAQVTEIRDRAFENCLNLATATMHDGLKTIGSEAFYGCGLTEVTVPATVEDVEGVPRTDEDGKVIRDADGNVQTFTKYGIGVAAFHTCEKLERATVLGSVKTVPAGAFGYCPALKEIYLPASVKEVQGAYYSGSKVVVGHAFHNCKQLTDVYFGGTSEEWSGVKIDMGGKDQDMATYDNAAIKNATLHPEAQGLPARAE